MDFCPLCGALVCTKLKDALYSFWEQQKLYLPKLHMCGWQTRPPHSSSATQDCQHYRFFRRSMDFRKLVLIWSLSKLNSSVHLFHEQMWNGTSTVFMNHNKLITPQKKLQKNRRCSMSILGHMKKILHLKMRRSNIENLLLWNIILGAKTCFSGNSYILCE